MFIDSLFQLSKLPTPDVQNVLPLCEHMPADAFFTHAVSTMLCCRPLQTSTVAASVRRHCWPASHRHIAVWLLKSCSQRGFWSGLSGGHRYGEI